MPNIAEFVKARAHDPGVAIRFEDETYTWPEYVQGCATRAAYLQTRFEALAPDAPHHVGLLLDIGKAVVGDNEHVGFFAHAFLIERTQHAGEISIHALNRAQRFGRAGTEFVLRKIRVAQPEHREFRHIIFP